jgi:hypothetical protein
MTKIPCFISVWMDYNGLKHLIPAASVYSELELIVVENKSRFSNTIIRPYLIEQVKKGVVSKYYHFERNIFSDSIGLVRYLNIDLILNSDYIIITDGDMVPVEHGWLEEQLNIMEKHPEVHACSLGLVLDNLPFKTKPDLSYHLLQMEHRVVIPTDKDYIERPTGHWFTLIRGAEYAGYLAWIYGMGVQLDQSHRIYCNMIGKKWVRAKEHRVRHFGWYLCHEGEPYHQLRNSAPPEHVIQPRSCPYWEYTAAGEVFHNRPFFGGSVFNTEYGE